MSAAWRLEAACRGRDDVDFFPDPSDTRGLARAQLVCRDCPVKMECADHAREEREKYGVWGGVNLGAETWAYERERKNRDRSKRRREQYGRDEDHARTRREQAHTTRPCDECSIRFVPARKDARFCSPPCYRRWWARTVARERRARPDLAERNRERRRAYYAENGEYERARERRRYQSRAEGNEAC